MARRPRPRDAARLDREDPHHGRRHDGTADGPPGQHRRRAGAAPNEIVLVGGGDPTLTAQPIGTESFYPGSARLDDLADQIRRSGVAADTILVDTRAYTGPALADGWFPADIAGGYIAPMEPVMLDGGRIDPLEDESARSATPALDVGRALAEKLGIDPANVRLGAANSGAAPVASVQSAPLRDRLGQMMWRSDNVLAEAIGREVAIATNTDPSFAGATKAVTDTLAAAGMDVAGVHLADASGLSVDNAIPARVLDRVLTAAAGDGQPQLRPMLDYLPVAGATGTLADRYAAGDRAGAGWVRAKTGTLDEASALVGYVVDTDQRVLTFALMSNGSPPGVSPPRARRDRGDIAFLWLPVTAGVDMQTTELEQQTAPEEAKRNGFAGAVDWGLAAKAGAMLSPNGPATSRYTAENAVAELADASIAAEAPVRAVTGLADGLPVPTARIVDRPGWIHAAADSMAQLTGASGADSGWLTGKPAGLQAGAMLAFVSTAILGQYDPFTGEDGTLLLVAPNIVSVERALQVNPSDFRLWVCLHEVTHRVQFSANPWLAGYMRDTVAVLGEIGDEPMSEVVSRLAAAVRDRRSGGGERRRQRRHPRSAAGHPGAPQREALDKLLVLGTLLEGHADHVMDAVGPEVVPSVVAIRAAFEHRRKRSVNPLQRLVRALLGIDAKMAQYVRGKKFVDEVVGRVGMAEFNTIWTGPDTLPLPAEIDEPGRWVARVLG